MSDARIAPASARTVELFDPVVRFGAHAQAARPFAEFPVKIGPVCEDTTPPRLDVSSTHWIACHHPVSVLETLDPALPVGLDVGASSR